LGIFPRHFQQRSSRLLQIASVGDTDWDTKTHSRVAVSPIRDRRIDELRVGHDHGDVVVGENDGAACANLLHLTGDTRDLHTIADRDRSFCQNDKAADEVAGDILQPKADADTDRAGKNGESGKVNAGVVQNNENANNKDDIADDLRDGVLQRPIQAAVYEEAVKEKWFCPRRYPKNSEEEGNEQENLDERERDARQRSIPSQRDASRVDRGDREKDQRGKAEDGRDDRDKILAELESGEETAE